MNIDSLLKQYIESLKSNLELATEHTYRSGLENLIKQVINNSKISITNEPKKTANKQNKQDFVFSKEGLNIGFIETKKIDEDLSKTLKSHQIKRYIEESDNIILTNYIEFIWIYKGNPQKSIILCSLDDLKNHKKIDTTLFAESFKNLIDSFISQHPTKITKASVLANKLANPTQQIRDLVANEINSKKQNRIVATYTNFKELLVKDISVNDFADAFAQTFSYSLFLTKLTTLKPNEILASNNIANFVPQHFNLLKDILLFVTELDNYPEIKPFVEQICITINHIDVLELKEDLAKKDNDLDPYIYFYESFLGAYDNDKKKNLGVWYTPKPIVNFIVNNVNEILKKDFNFTEGLANNKVKILDFACGTGTFLESVYGSVLNTAGGNNLKLDDAINNHLLKNVYGFELLIPAYVIAHLKLSSMIEEKSPNYFSETKNKNKRIQVYFTNTLDNAEASKQQTFASIFPAMAEEGKKASEIKQQEDILVILGNPPYNIKSKNILHTNGSLYNFHQSYKPDNEGSVNSLSDDYIKFLAFAHQKVIKNKQGVIGIIVNNSFLSGITHRKMRSQLVKDFNQIYIINLNGDNRKKIEGDKSVFNIQQGVAIAIFVKTQEQTPCKVYYKSLTGIAKDKFNALKDINIENLADITKDIQNFNSLFKDSAWGQETIDGEIPNTNANIILQTSTDKLKKATKSKVKAVQGVKYTSNLRFVEELNFFIPKESDGMLAYSKFLGVKNIFKQVGSGIQTGRDYICIQLNKQDISKVVNDFANLSEQEIALKYKAKDSRDWTIKGAKEYIVGNINNDNLKTTIAFKPFDNRYTFYATKSKSFMRHPNHNNSKHMLLKNIGLSVQRAVEGDSLTSYNAISITDKIMDINYSGGQTYLAPLYLYKEQNNNKANVFNFDEDAVNNINKEPNFTQNFKELLKQKFANKTPEDVFYYIYGFLHHPNYRIKYLDLLKIDFPRVNFAVSENTFNKIAILGKQLADLHLLKNITTHSYNFTTIDNKSIDYKAIKPKYNPITQELYITNNIYCKNISAKVYNYTIGGYKVIESWLKARQNIDLSYEDITHLENTIYALSQTVEIEKQLESINYEENVE